MTPWDDLARRMIDGTITAIDLTMVDFEAIEPVGLRDLMLIADELILHGMDATPERIRQVAAMPPDRSAGVDPELQRLLEGRAA